MAEAATGKANSCTVVRHGELLLERAMFNKNKTDSSRLVAAARSLLTLVLRAHGLRESCWEFHVDMTDVVGTLPDPTPYGSKRLTIQARVLCCPCRWDPGNGNAEARSKEYPQ
jgi:hypothetical protein